MNALLELAQTIDSGAICSQDAGDGPRVFVSRSERVFASRTARAGERLGLMQHAWCPESHHWRWSLTAKGRRWLAEQQKQSPTPPGASDDR